MIPRPWPTVALVLLALAAGSHSAPPNPEPAMAISNQTARALIPLTDEQLFDVTPARLDALMLALSDTDFDGLLLRAPARVAIHDETTLPAVLASRETVLRAWQVMPGDNLLLFAMDLDTGVVRFARPLADPKEALASFEDSVPRPPPPNAAAASGHDTGAWHLDARALLGLHWEPAHVNLFAISLDRASNSVQVLLDAPLAHFASGPTAPHPPAAEGSGLPSYRQGHLSPAAPDAGATFELLVKGRDLAVAGAFVIPARDAHLAQAPRLAAAAGIRALVPATVAILRLDGRAPWLVPLVIPVYGDAPANPGAPLHGWFTVDVTAQLGHPLPAGHYAAWLLFEGVPLGPRRFKL